MSPVQQNAVMIAVLCNILNGTSVTCNATALATAGKCFTGMNPIQQGAVIIYLLCQISATGGGGGGSSNVTSGDYGGGQPDFTPATDTAIAIDTSNGTIWSWYSNSWH